MMHQELATYGNCRVFTVADSLVYICVLKSAARDF